MPRSKSECEPLISTRPQLNLSPEPSPVLHPRLLRVIPNDFTLEDTSELDQNALIEDFRSRLLRQVFSKTAVPPPEGFAYALADRVTFGRYKYSDPDTRQLRDHHNEVVFAEAGDFCSLAPPQKDDSRSERFRKALVEAVTTYLDIVKSTGLCTFEDQKAVLNFDPRLRRRGVASAYINDLVGFLFYRAEGDELQKMSTAAKLVTGFGFQFDASLGPWCTIGKNQAEVDVDRVYWKVLSSLVANTLNCDARTVFSSPGQRWKLALSGKLTMSIIQELKIGLIEVAGRMVDIDFCHNVLEGGLAIAHPLGWHAMVGPNLACVLFVASIGGYKIEKKELIFGNERSALNWHLLDDDKDLEVEIFGRKVPRESVVSFQAGVFKSEALSDFIDWDVGVRQGVLISKKGAILYFPTSVGPWEAQQHSDADTKEIVRLILSVTPEERQSAQFMTRTLEMQQQLEQDWLRQTPFPERTRQRFRYIRNKPGRVLVQRRGLAGSCGILIIAALLTCGVVTGIVNWAERDNWLERVFDGAQVSSLLAGLFIVFIFFVTGTLTDTIDLLAGVASAEDMDQLALLTGLNVSELQGMLTYARGTLYWLSEHNTSYCRAVRLGQVVMTDALAVDGHAATRNNLVVGGREADGSRRAVWVMQARYSRLEQSEGYGGPWRVAEELKFEDVKVRGCSDGAVADLE